jgi:Mrp family chromosome partitioning ATPase
LVLLTRENVVTGVTDTQDPAVFDSRRFLTTQANVAGSPRLASRVAAAAEVPGLTPGAALAATSVAPQVDSDLLEFSVSWPTANDAVVIANTYAREYTRFKAELDTARINSALREIRTRMRSLEARGQADGVAYQTLAQYQNQLIIGRFLTGNSASVLQPAETAGEIRADPLRNVAAAGLLGLVLALGLVFLAEALDRRVRTEEELEAVLALPLLGRVSRPPRSLQNENRLVMLADPFGPHSEAFRKLRTNIEFVNLERRARTIMFTSALPREGKSTTAANLAVAFARTGRRVALVDLDVRLPLLHTFFNVRDNHGIAEVVVGDETLDQALQRIVLPAAGSASPATGNGRPVRPRWSPSHRDSAAPSLRAPLNGRSDADSVLHLLPCGTIPPAHAEFLENERVLAVLEELQERFEIVLVDAPPLLAVGDAMTLSTKVDAMVVVTHVGIRRPFLHELARQLENCPAAPLGFILTGVPQSDGYGYGYGYRGHPADVDPKTAERNPQRV